MLCIEALPHHLSCIGLGWHQTPPAIGQFQGAHSELLCKEASIQCQSCPGVGWHQTPPAIEQLQGAHSELQWKEALLEYLFALGLCWHLTPQEIGQLQGTPDKLRCKEALLHRMSCLGLCWHLLLWVKIHIWDFRLRLPPTTASFHLHLQNWDFVASSNAAQEVYHHFPHMPPWFRHLVPYQEVETPFSQAAQLLGPRFDHHPSGQLSWRSRSRNRGTPICFAKRCFNAFTEASANSSFSKTAIDSPVTAETTSTCGTDIKKSRISHLNHLKWNILKQNGCLEAKMATVLTKWCVGIADGSKSGQPRDRSDKAGF